MHLTRRSLAAAPLSVVVALSNGAVVTAQSDDDVPKRQPSLMWEVPVSCDSDASVAAGADPPRFCSLDVAGNSVYLHEYSDFNAEGGRFRLSAFDIATGAPRWSVDVGRTAQMQAYNDAIVLNDKTHIEVIDPDTGELRFTADGELAAVNRYDTLLMSDGATVTALDPRTGAELWSADGSLGAWCRDMVILVPAAGAHPGGEPFAVRDHYTGDVRWRSEFDFDPAVHEIACGFGPYVYTTDGTQAHEWDAFEGWLNWSAPVPNAGAIEIYREVALIRSGVNGETVVAVERETGEVLWELPAEQVGTTVSLVGRLREDASGVFTLHPFTGDVVNQVSPSTVGGAFEVVGASETRVVVAVGGVVTTYGMSDLGISWQLDVGGDPQDFGVSAGFLVVRDGDALRGYG